jgi:hypothetical protein
MEIMQQQYHFILYQRSQDPERPMLILKDSVISLFPNAPPECEEDAQFFQLILS